MSDPNQGYDVVILGSGSAGYACALRASQLDLSVAIIEKDKLGGTCLHTGCIPTKALLHAGEVADSAREAAEFGVQAELTGIDMAGVNKYKDGVVAKLYKGLQGMFKANKAITIISGTGKLTGPNTVDVDGQQITGRHIVLATGSYSKTLPGLDIDGTKVITSEHALKLDKLPGSAIILGGGVIGVEFASAWKSLGVDVTIVEALPRLVPAEDADSSKMLERAFRKRGIAFKTGKPFETVKTTANGVALTISGGETLEADLLLVAVGRGPSTAGLGYEEQGINMDRGFVLTNEHLQTNVPGVYAIGDIVPGVQLAHRGFGHGIFVAEHIGGLNPTPIDEAGIPRVTYTEPEVASVGLNEDKAREKYGDDAVKTYNYNLAGNGKSNILKTQGFVKLVSVKDGPVVGVHMVGSRMGEQIGEGQLIYNWEAFPSDVAQLIHMHPTQNEALGEAHLALAGKPLHAHA
ncbi:dihydrolipoamide dehydrogenase [Stackebrandtia endophytica]|uniref:Dihydrolipoyl dehydrogenase n=1 Tax=Stackebrandtia endophytica TaxID=1496996 RepID=A0A543B2Q3_9ACTN|nr:dihydrolipoyl dehydrogenase [Stackebrandtia endophytica]TQL79117.1 dihydrolipoamide dehydrogenase [Stackebrandtia endophytica]